MKGYSVIRSACISAAMALLLMSTTAVAGSKDNNGGVTIKRDDYGVPHVFASTEYSLWYGVGYAQAQDRLWQAEVLRRTATGRTSELFGPSALEGDVAIRTIFGNEALRMTMFESASTEVQLALEAYAAGMNAYIREAVENGQLPIEFVVFNFAPEEWKPTDSIAVLQLLFYQFGEAGSEELTSAAHLQTLIATHGPEEGAKIFQDTRWLNDPDAPTTVPDEGAYNPPRRGAAPKADLPRELAGAKTAAQKTLRALNVHVRVAGLSGGPASNAALIGPNMSSDGRALLLGGPQMGYTVPQINHEMGIHRGQLEATGMEIAGAPWIVIGVTSDFAWSLTTGGTDNMDIYVEVINPENPGQYLFNGEWVDYDCRAETFVVAGAPPFEQLICESVHGPILGTAPGIALTLKRAVRGHEMATYQSMFALWQAKSVEEVDRILGNFAPNLNFYYADRRGNIAYWHMGRIPVRAAGDNPWLPHDGTGAAEWQGFIPWADMPRARNPESGWLANWNNKPRADWNNSTLNFWDWGPVHRVNTFRNFLSAVEPGTATTETLEALNIVGGFTTQTPSDAAAQVFVPTLLETMLDHVDPSADPRLAGVVELLAGWDELQLDMAPMDGLYDNPAVAIFNSWWSALSERVFADELGPADNEESVQADMLNVVGNLVYRLLDSDPAIPLLHDYLDGESVGEALTASLVDALDVLEVQYGSADMAQWLQPIAEIAWDPIGAGSVPNTIWMNRGTYNQIVHHGPGTELRAVNVIAPGQSGDPFSPHFADQLLNYATWSYKPMRLSREDLLGVTTSTIRLQPKMKDH